MCQPFINHSFCLSLLLSSGAEQLSGSDGEVGYHVVTTSSVSGRRGGDDDQATAELFGKEARYVIAEEDEETLSDFDEARIRV